MSAVRALAPMNNATSSDNQRFVAVPLRDDVVGDGLSPEAARLRQKGGSLAELCQVYGGIERRLLNKHLARFEKQLKAAGYVRGDRWVSPKIVRVIYDQLGEP